MTWTFWVSAQCLHTGALLGEKGDTNPDIVMRGALQAQSILERLFLAANS